MHFFFHRVYYDYVSPSPPSKSLPIFPGPGDGVVMQREADTRTRLEPRRYLQTDKPLQMKD